MQRFNVADVVAAVCLMYCVNVVHLVACLSVCNLLNVVVCAEQSSFLARCVYCSVCQRDYTKSRG